MRVKSDKSDPRVTIQRGYEIRHGIQWSAELGPASRGKNAVIGHLTQGVATDPQHDPRGLTQLAGDGIEQLHLLDAIGNDVHAATDGVPLEEILLATAVQIEQFRRDAGLQSTARLVIGSHIGPAALLPGNLQNGTMRTGLGREADAALWVSPLEDLFEGPQVLADDARVVDVERQLMICLPP